MPAMIKFSNVSRCYPGEIFALSDVSFAIDAGEMVFLSGPSGAGKSTLLKLIAALDRPTSGHVLVNGQDISRLDRVGIPYLRRKLGLILQQHTLLDDRTLLDNVMLPLLVLGASRREAEPRARAALERVGLIDRVNARPPALSGGEQQRAEIARALVNKPQIIIADEPTANLDRDNAHLVLDALATFKDAGVTCMISTHDDRFLHRASRVLYLRQGKLVNDRRLPAHKRTP